MRNLWPLILGLFLIPIFIPISVQAASLHVPILTYHYIANNPNPKDRARNGLSVSPDKFEAQMQYLAQNGYTPITLDTLYGIYNSSIGLVTLPASFIAGFLWDKINPSAPFLFGAVIASIASVCLFIFTRFKD